MFPVDHLVSLMPQFKTAIGLFFIRNKIASVSGIKELQNIDKNENIVDK